MGLFSKLKALIRKPFSNLFNRSSPLSPDPEEVMEEPEQLDDFTDEYEQSPFEEPPDISDLAQQSFEESMDYSVDPTDSFLSWDGQILDQYEEMLDSLVSGGYVSDFTNEESRKEFLRFLESDFWKYNKEYLPPSGDTFERVQDAIEHGAKVSDLENEFLEWEMDESYDHDEGEGLQTLWTGWYEY